VLERRRRGADRVPHLVLEEDHHARARQEWGLREAGGRLAQEPAAQDLERVEGGDRIQLRQRRGAPAGGVVAGLLLALEQEDVGHTSLGEEVRERGAGDAAADDDHLEATAIRHVRPLTIPRPDPARRRALLIASSSRSGLDAIAVTIPAAG